MSVHQKLSVTTLLHHRGVNLALRCLGSLAKFSEDPIEYIIFDDGSLTSRDIAVLHSQLPVKRIVLRSESDSYILDILGKYPNCLRMRNMSPLSLKLFDIPLTIGGHMLYCDSDILFLRKFNELFCLPNGIQMVHMADIQNASTLWPWQIKPLSQISIVERFNSGILIFDCSFYNLDILEEFLRSVVFSPSVRKKNLCWAEQTCWAVMCSKLNCIHLDPLQFPIATPKVIRRIDSAIAIHFVTPSRKLIDDPVFSDLRLNPSDAISKPIAFRSNTMNTFTSLAMDVTQSLGRRYQGLVKFGKWPAKYLLFYGKWMLLDPCFTIKSLFVPGLITPSRYFCADRAEIQAIDSRDIEQAASLFMRDGFVVLKPFLTREHVLDLRLKAEEAATEILHKHRAGILNDRALHGKLRYSYGDAGVASWHDLASNAVAVQILREIWKHKESFFASSVGGDFNLPGASWQPLHSDLGRKASGYKLPSMITVNYYVSDVTEENGPIRIVPRSQRWLLPSPSQQKREPEWMKKSIITGKAGTVIIRDPRAWHGGTPNASQHPRYMLNCEYVAGKTDTRRAGGVATLQALNNRIFISEFKCRRSGGR